MKIALMILHADPARGGAERYTADLAIGLRGRGHDVSVLASTVPDGADPGHILLPTDRATRSGRYLQFLDRLDEHLSSTTYDVMHAMLPVRRCSVYHPHAGLAAESISRGHLKHAGWLARAAAQTGTRLNRRRQLFARVERQLLEGQNPPVVLCLSDYVKRTVVEHYPHLAPSRLRTLFNAIDTTRFNPVARPREGAAVRARFKIGPAKTVALMIAQDFERKGLRQVLLAMAEMHDERLVLLVIGKENPGSYARLAARLGVGHQVVFAGTTDDPHSFYRAADFFVLPTRHDPCSLVVLEALAMGLPVISTVFNGACEIMTHGRHGYVLSDPCDTPALAEALLALLDPARRAEMSAACLGLRPQLAYGQHLDRLIEVYRELKA